MAEEFSPDTQAKLFPPDSLLWDRLSLISNESVSSASETDKGAQPIDQAFSYNFLFFNLIQIKEKICLQLSDWLIQSMEQQRWREFSSVIDFRDEVDPAIYFGHSSGGSFHGWDQMFRNGLDTSISDYHQQEGNSVFYAQSKEVGRSDQLPSTSRWVFGFLGFKHVWHSVNPTPIWRNYNQYPGKIAIWLGTSLLSFQTKKYLIRFFWLRLSGLIPRI